MKNTLMIALGTVGACITSLFGGWDASLITVLIFMAIDYLSGLVVAGIFHKSPKTPNGSLESKAGWKGICRKGISLAIILVACRLDILFATSYMRDAVCIAFIANEAISIVENAGFMGVPIPAFLINAIEVLKSKNDGKDDVDNDESK